MKTGLKVFSILGAILTSGFIGLGENAAAGALEETPVLTIHVANRAEVDPMTLIQAKRTATEIFKKAGVESRWVDSARPPEGKPENSVYKGPFTLSHIQLTILPSLMANRLGLPYDLPNGAMGLAPGNGRERQSVYVLYDRVEALAMRHVKETQTDTAQILGHVFAHEVGHLLLNDPTHSEAGIMRSPWNLWDLQNASYGHLLFTRRQAKAITAEVSRRFGK